MATLYHYTSLNTLVKIIGGIKNNKMYLRAGNAKKMNDPNDCYYFVNLLVQRGKIDTTSMNEICDMKDKYDSPYLISLSEHMDDLHMWNCYGDDGRGVAIGIELENLRKDVVSFFDKNHISTKLYECKYPNINDLPENEEFEVINVLNAVDRNFWTNEDISNISNIVKHPAYEYEKEWRIVIRHGEKEPAINGVFKEEAFFVDIPISHVKTIVVGPSANYEAVKKVFSPFFDEKIFVKSTIPYRSK